jgi:uncharacterized iron-regulated membrane protein
MWPRPQEVDEVMDIGNVTPRTGAVEPVKPADARYEKRVTLDQASGETVARKVDRLTGEVARQIPAEEELKLQAAIRALLGNAFEKIDRRA